MSGCIGCDDDTGYTIESDGTVTLRITRDKITTEEKTTLKELGLEHANLTGLALHNAMQPHIRQLQKKRDASDRA